jgi:hypothetical protein
MWTNKLNGREICPLWPGVPIVFKAASGPTESSQAASDNSSRQSVCLKVSEGLTFQSSLKKRLNSF